MEDVRILFMGTPVFAAEILKTLKENNYNVVGVVSQLDKPVGRKQILEPTPVKKTAIDLEIPVYQFDKIKNHLDFLDQVKPDLIITCAYGQILPKYILDYPHLGCINVHASLLPKLRGGAPIHHSIIDGYTKTGISIMDMVEAMDAGDIYSQIEVNIDDEDNLDSLSIKLIEAAKKILIDTLPKYLNGTVKRLKQDENLVTFGFNIKKEEERIDFNKPVREVFNLIRGLSSIPCAHCFINDKICKIYKTQIVEENTINEAGEVICTNKEMIIKCAKGSLRVLELQMEGKKRMDIKSFLNGNKEEIRGAK